MANIDIQENKEKLFQLRYDKRGLKFKVKLFGRPIRYSSPLFGEGHGKKPSVACVRI
jgi:hypothetical protein